MERNTKMNRILYPIRNGVLGQGYDDNYLPELYKSLGLKSHGGVDITSFHKDKIFLSETGTCYKVWDEVAPTLGSVTRGYGVHVLTDLDENGICREWVFWHMRSTIEVKEGIRYEQGTILGEEGASGAVYYGNFPVPDNEKGKPPFKGTHLHWGYKEVQRTKDSNFDGTTEFLHWTSGKLYVDKEGYFYKVLNYNNGNKGLLDPMKLDIIYYDEWLAQKALKIVVTVTALPNEIEGVPELKSGLAKFLSTLLNLLRKVF